jgi:hypothetical protein
MSFIWLLLVVKIGVTGLFAVLPFLLLPADKLAAMSGIAGAEGVFRLYALALAALLVGYSTGFPLIAQGQFPYGVAAMGIVSNGGQAAYLFASGNWRKSKAMTIFIALIALGLVGAWANADAAMAPLW